MSYRIPEVFKELFEDVGHKGSWLQTNDIQCKVCGRRITRPWEESIYETHWLFHKAKGDLPSQTRKAFDKLDNLEDKQP